MSLRSLLPALLMLPLAAPAQSPAVPTPADQTAPITAAATIPHRQQLVTRAPYVLAPGDKFSLAYQFTPEQNQTVVVQPDGEVNLNLIGSVQVSGLTTAQATDLITTRSAVHLKDPRIVLTLVEFHKPFFVVAGEIKHPGRYDMEQPTTAYQALLLAGGWDVASQSSQVVLFRRINAEQDEVHILDLHRMKKPKDMEHDMLLEPGDMLLVPRDRIAKMDRLIRASNIGVYVNPLSNLP